MAAIPFNPYGIVIKTASGDAILAGSGIVTVQTQGAGIITIGAQIPGNLVINSVTPWQPPMLADSTAPNNSVYYSTDTSKLSYKDPLGATHNLY